jgi:hypothetical protein
LEVADRKNLPVCRDKLLVDSALLIGARMLLSLGTGHKKLSGLF